MVERDVRAIDGSAVTITLSADESDLSDWSSPTLVEWAGHHEWELLSGRRELPAALAEVNGLTFTERVAIGEFSVDYGTIDQYDNENLFIGELTVASVAGKRFACHLHDYNAGPDRLLQLLELVSFEETNQGFVVTGRSPKVFVRRDATSVIQPVSDLGVVEVHPLTGERIARIPATGGYVTGSGSDVFSMKPESPSHYFLVISASAYTTVAPLADPRSSKFLDRLDSLSISWTP